MIITTDILADRFAKYNKLYFDDELPTPDFFLLKSYSKLGMFRFIEIRSRRKIKYVKILISCYYDWTEKQLRSVLVHEMIHYYVEYKHFHNGQPQHGELFTNKMNELNKKYHLNIEVVYDIYKLKVAKGAPILPRIGAFFTTLF
ncbi:SprT-like domain-containing protein [Porphyromonas uenonis]|uniref:SprT-like domain-containing protein n=1 Tax=Porphyromonas uenonis TaxID=281920 RepID=UPI0026F2B438|nr:SprT-like domain-containing protein [Porphyromonas uenonis]